jgi:Methyltransferase domain
MNLLETYNYTKCISDKECNEDFAHKYISNFYEEKIGHKKNDNINILEIGINHGYSLKLWQDYFTNANIYGFDISDQINVKLNSNVHTKFFNAYSDEALEYLKNLNIKFDIIIDDGPHSIESQDYTCKNYKQFLKDDGILFIEDIHIDKYKNLHEMNPEFKIINLCDVAFTDGHCVVFYYNNKE